MGEVAVNLHGRLYRFDCGDGEEARFAELAAYFKGRIEALAQQYGNVGADRLMLAAALLITDELMDARATLAERAVADKAATDKAAHDTLAPSTAGSGKATADKASTENPKPVGALPRTPGADKREQDALRNEFRRKLAAGSDA